MRLFNAAVEIGTNDDVTEEMLEEKLSSVIQEFMAEAKFFRINKIEKRKVASGEYKLNIDEALRLKLDRLKTQK